MTNNNSPINKKNIRNEDLICDYIKSVGIVKGKRVFKYSMLELISKYNISAVRIFQILKDYKVPKRIKN